MGNVHLTCCTLVYSFISCVLFFEPTPETEQTRETGFKGLRQDSSVVIPSAYTFIVTLKHVAMCFLVTKLAYLTFGKESVSSPMGHINLMAKNQQNHNHHSFQCVPPNCSEKLL